MTGHGKASRYRSGCHCDECRAAHTARIAEQRARRRRGEQLTPADGARFVANVWRERAAVLVEDAGWLADSGDTPETAAARLGVTVVALERRLRRWDAAAVWQRLRDNRERVSA